jgi:antitoxin YefM
MAFGTLEVYINSSLGTVLTERFLVVCAEIPYNMAAMMNTISVNKFREHLKCFVEQVIDNHTPLKVTRRSGEDFVVISVEDWEREQETLYISQNTNLMKQIAASSTTHAKGKGRFPTAEALNEITGI